MIRRLLLCLLLCLPFSAEAASGRAGLLSGHRDPWSPYVLPLSIAPAWWDADDHGTALMTDDGAGLISSFKDRRSFLALTGTTTTRPTWSATGFDGVRSGVTFDGVANALTLTGVSTLPVGSAEGWIWTAASSPAILSSVEAAFSYGGTSNGQNRRLSSSGTHHPQASDGTSSSNSTIVWNSANIVGGHFDPANITVRVNGVPGPVASWSAATLLVRTRMGAGPANTANALWQGPVRHVIVTGPLTAAQEFQMDGYMAWNSGLQGLLPAGSPYANFPP